jgi:two-component system sensor histidine kinase/response regulator
MTGGYRFRPSCANAVTRGAVFLRGAMLAGAVLMGVAGLAGLFVSGAFLGPWTELAGAVLLILGGWALAAATRRAADARSFERALDLADTVGVLLVDAAGHPFYANPALRRLTGIAEGSAGEAQALAGLLDSAAGGGAVARERLHSEGRWRGEIRRPAPGGGLTELEAGAFRLGEAAGRAGKPCGWALVVSDLSERRRVERGLEEARDTAERASRAKNEFLAKVSHEIRTPMNAVLGFAQILRKDSALAPVHQRSVDAILRGGEHLLELLDNILQIHRIEAGRTRLNVRAFDLPALLLHVETILRGRAEAKGLDFAVAVPAELPQYIRADEGMIRQILINLLDNAVKFTDSGHVELRVAVQTKDTTCELVCAVSDSGPGIAAAALENIFQPFVQAGDGRDARGGMGLGLAISQEFARLMGGRIAAQSTPGAGSVFTLTIPVVPVGAVAVDLGSGRTVKRVRKDVRAPLVLNVDDEALNRSMVCVLLRKMGFEVCEAADGLEALRSVAARRPDLVLLDLAMPVMDGIEFLRRLRATREEPHVPVVVLTAHAFADERDRALAAGADGFIRKPFRLDELLQTIARFANVEYEYEEPAEPAAGAGPAAGRPGAAAIFAALPAEWRERLARATAGAEIERIEALAEEIREQSPVEAALLRAKLQRFDYAGILRCLPEASGARPEAPNASPPAAGAAAGETA